MAKVSRPLGGGNFLTHNKRLPGVYINVISRARASNTFADRGYCAMALPFDWAKQGEIFIIQNEDLQTESYQNFGMAYTDERLKPIRELMLGAKTLYLYNLNDEAEKAKAVVGGLNIESKNPGVGGNEIKVKLQNDVDSGAYVLTIYFGEKRVYENTIKAVEDAVNDFVDIKGEITEESITAGTNLAGGANGDVSVGNHSDFLDKIEPYYVNAIGYYGEDEELKKLYHEFGKRMRDEVGAKTQIVIAEKGKNKYDYEGTIEVDNIPESVFWVAGRSSGCAVNRSLTNEKYNGEYNIEFYTKSRDGENALNEGKFAFYGTNDEIRVIEDINSFISFTLYKNQDFSKNQVIRVVDQRATDISRIFIDRYLGKVLNNKDGRIAFWQELVNHAETLQNLGAIEDYDPKETTVERGTEKDEVIVNDPLSVVMAMQKLYMTIEII